MSQKTTEFKRKIRGCPTRSHATGLIPSSNVKVGTRTVDGITKDKHCTKAMRPEKQERYQALIVKMLHA